MSETWILKDTSNGNIRECDSRSEAEDAKQDLASIGADIEDLQIIPPNDAEQLEEQVDSDTEVVDMTDEETASDTSHANPMDLQDQPDLPQERNVETDPLDILPSYMIDTVQGTPTLNKRGLSVLAFHYGVSIQDREIVVSPHESDWEYAIVETTVVNEDGNTFVGSGTAHVDRGDEKGILLEMAETRSYKRAVSFATGTGIVSYQEMVGELE